MGEPPSYAPTATSSYTVPTTNYHEEITKSSLIKSPIDRSVLDSMAEIYSIITVLEMIENSYIKDYITDKEKYTLTTLRLINQYQIILKGFKEDDLKKNKCNELLNSSDFASFLDDFTRKFKLNCPLAINRLSRGVPITIELFENESSNNSSRMSPSLSNIPVSVEAKTGQVRLIAECTSNFITCMDALKLNYKTKDQLHPLLSELVINLNELIEINAKFEFPGKSKLINWLIKLNNLQQELDSEEIEQFLSDLNTAYKNFYLILE